MSRRFHGWNELPKYLDHEITLNAKGQFYCPDYNFTASTMEEVKAHIKAQQAKKDRLPVIEAYYNSTYDGWRKVNTTGTPVGYRSLYVWVTWPTYPENPKSSKEKKQVLRDSVYPVTDKNTAILSQLKDIGQKIEQLQEQYHDLQETMDTLPPAAEED